MGCEALATKAELDALKNTVSGLNGKIKELENQLNDKATKNDLKTLSNYVTSKINDLSASINYIKDELPKKFNSNDFKGAFESLFTGAFMLGFFNIIKPEIVAVSEFMGSKLIVVEGTLSVAVQKIAALANLISGILALINSLGILKLQQDLLKETEQRQASDVVLSNDISKALGFASMAIQQAKNAKLVADQAIQNSKEANSNALAADQKAGNAINIAKVAIQKVVDLKNQFDANFEEIKNTIKAIFANIGIVLADLSMSVAEALSDAQKALAENKLQNYEINKINGIANQALSEADLALNENKFQAAKINSLEAIITDAVDLIQTLKKKVAGLELALGTTINQLKAIVNELKDVSFRLKLLEGSYNSLNEKYQSLKDSYNYLLSYVGSLLNKINNLPKNLGGSGINADQVKSDLTDLLNQQSKALNDLANKQQNDLKQLESQQSKSLKDLETKQDNKLDEALKDNVNDKNLGDKMKELLPGILTGAILTGLAIKIGQMITPAINNTLQGMNNTINQINQNTQPAQQISNTQTGICNSLSGGCLGNQVAAPLQNVANTANTNNGLLFKLMAMMQALSTLLQGFIATAWTPFINAFNQLYKNLGIDRALKVINTALILHNAAMLSNNLVQTLGDTIDITLQAIGFKWLDGKGEQLEFSQVLGSSVKDFVISIVGAKAYTDTVKGWKSLSTIYQASANLLYSVRGFFDESLELSVMVAEKVAKWMNIAREDGLVREDSYPQQPETVTPQNKFTRAVQKYTDGLSEAEDSLDSVGMISSSVVGVKSEFVDLKETKDNFAATIKTETDTLKKIYADNKESSQIEPTDTPTKEDFKAVN